MMHSHDQQHPGTPSSPHTAVYSHLMQSPSPHTIPAHAGTAHSFNQATSTPTSGTPILQQQASPSHQYPHASPSHHQQQQQYNNNSNNYDQSSHQSEKQQGGSKMRQRAVQKNTEQEEEPDQLRRFVRNLKTLDVYPKTEEDIAIKTQSGGVVSIASLCIIAFLVLSELWSFVNVTTTHSIMVDTRPSSQLAINLDITFHALRCSETVIDVMDVSGDAQVAIESNMHRVRLGQNGMPLEKGEYEDHAHDSDAQPTAEQAAQDRMLAAMGLRQPYQPGNVPQGGGGDVHSDRRGEGCRIFGQLAVNKVAGNVHIALGGAHTHHTKHEPEPVPAQKGATTGTAPHHDPTKPASHHAPRSQQQQHLHQFMIHEMASYNCSHTINHFSFGQDYPGVINPLDGVSMIIPHNGGSAHQQYFIKVVPTLYISTSGKRLETNQFSMTQHREDISPMVAFGGGGSTKIPGVFFVYDLSPFMVRVVETRMPFSTFVTSLFAIVGGVFTIAGLADSIWYHSSKVIRVTSPKLK